MIPQLHYWTADHRKTQLVAGDRIEFKTRTGTTCFKRRGWKLEGENGTTEFRVDIVSYDELLRWMAELEGEIGLTMEQISPSRADSASRFDDPHTVFEFVITR